MNQPSPAIVTQAGVRRLPRWGLLLFCAVYVMAGFIGRDPWRKVDITSLGYMLDLAQGRTGWLASGLPGADAHFDALLPYWLGAWAIQLTPAGMSTFLSVRLLSMSVLALTLFAVWYAIYYLARSPQAQPVSFAFGGEANPKDYARALADGGLLAFLASLGLAQTSHEVGPALYQLCFSAMSLYALAALPYRLYTPATFGVAGMLGLTLSGAPTLAMAYGVAGMLSYATRRQDWALLHEEQEGYVPDPAALQAHQQRLWRWVAAILLLTGLCAALASTLHLWHWRIIELPQRWLVWRSLIKLHLWFTWPIWPFIVWTLWRWRSHWRRGRPNRHLALPLALGVFCALGGWLGTRPEIMLLLGLPSFAALAAFALPTFRRSVSAFIDWFTLIFFTLGASYLWFMWTAMHLGAPASAVRQVAKQLHGYVPPFDWAQFLAGLTATLGWIYLVRWRTKRLRPAIWKSMILPAGGVCLSWVLLTTIWLPGFNYARGYVPVARQIASLLHTPLPAGTCAEGVGLDSSVRAAMQYHLDLTLQSGQEGKRCRWLLVHSSVLPAIANVYDMKQWQQRGTVTRPTDRHDAIHVFERVSP